ncbi:stress protein [Aeromonas schubertii]|uniref:Stress protein n=2 Tax=Aeromonas TaxID=642 RepID=A0A0S2SGM2_9GAMM|nr:stress protein [Aeromonas schubertii]
MSQFAKEARLIRHILLVTFKPSAAASEIEAVRQGFLAIPGLIPGVLAVEWGLADSPEGKEEGFTHCVLMTFADERARQRYLPHPDHEALKQRFRPVLERIIVFDYTLSRDDAFSV